VVHALSTVAGLRRGRSKARETESIKPVQKAHIEAVRPYLSRQVNALIDLQLLCGARGGELLVLRPFDIDTTVKIWIGKPVDHKLKYRGVERQIFFGPKAQKVLREFMVRHPKSFLFSPREAEMERRASAATYRRPNQKPMKRKTDRRIGELYTSVSYRRAIERACNKANVPRWTPHQLRHNAATAIRAEYGIEAAQLILGHASADVTQVYAETNKQKAFSIIPESLRLRGESVFVIRCQAA
jgi:integrase